MKFPAIWLGYRMSELIINENNWFWYRQVVIKKNEQDENYNTPMSKYVD